MADQSFEQLADTAASGLKPNHELYLDVKQELKTHLEDKAEFFSRQGKTPEESEDLSKQAFGSPMEMAAELLDANKKRMRFRSLMRIAFGALVVPLAVVLALCIVYGRQATRETFGVGIIPRANLLPTREDASTAGRMIYDAPEIKRVGPDGTLELNSVPDIKQVQAGEILSYWKAHRHDPDSKIYYAYYAGALDSYQKSKEYAWAMRLGERIDPQNGLYNLMLADYYLSHGISTEDMKSGSGVYRRTDRVLDRHMFKLGIDELQKAVSKPYVDNYTDRLLERKLRSMGRLLLTEDYIRRMHVISTARPRYYEPCEDIARMIPASARILIAQGRRADAERVMDTWKPYTRLLMDNASSHRSLGRVWQCKSATSNCVYEAIPVYERLGRYDKSREARSITKRLHRINTSRDADVQGEKPVVPASFFLAGTKAQTIMMNYKDFSPSESELKPGRMHEHAVAEEGATSIIIAVLAVSLLGTLVQGYFWLYRLRGAASVPILLLPPTKVLLKTLLLGVLLPGVVYWVYTRMPVIGGRDFGVNSFMMKRFLIEYALLTSAILWIPSQIIRRYIQKRCADLGIELPGREEKAFLTRKVWPVLLILGAALVFCITNWLDLPFVAREYLVILTPAATWFIISYLNKTRLRFGLYYGTMARSLAVVYAASIIFIAFTFEPWLTYNEVYWLRRDTITYGYLDQHRTSPLMTSSVEAKTADKCMVMIKSALEVKPQ